MAAERFQARALLEGLRGMDVYTLTRRSRNRVLAVEVEDALVATDRAPLGERVPLEEVQAALDRLEREGALEVTPEGIGSHRSSFIGAAIATLPGVTVESSRPRTLRFVASEGQALPESQQPRPLAVPHTEADSLAARNAVRELRLWEDFSRQEIHDIFSPDTTFQASRGPWGIAGLISIQQRPGDFVFLVTFGRSQSHHHFEESITEDGVIDWQSQPAQTLSHKRIRELIAHDERVNTVHLFLRASMTSSIPYTYFGPLGYLTHDDTREKPVYFQWQILEWPPPSAVVARVGLVLTPSTEATPPVPTRGALVRVDPPRSSGGRAGTSTERFRTRKQPRYADRDALNAELGLAGEKLVVQHEIDNLRRVGRHDLAERVLHTSVVEGDSAGYDVRSFTPNGEILHIEVKTTRGRRTAAFFVTANELAFSQENRATYRLYRLYEFDSRLGSANYFVTEGALDERFSLEPTEYRVRLRSNDSNGAVVPTT